MKLVIVTACDMCPLGVIRPYTPERAGCRHPENGNDEDAIFATDNPTELPDYVPEVCKLARHGEILIRADRTKILSRDAADRLAEIAEYEAAHPRGCVCEDGSDNCAYCDMKPEPL